MMPLPFLFILFARFLDQALAIGLVGEHHPAILDFPHHHLSAAKCLVGLLVGRIPFAVRLFPGGEHAYARIAKILQGILDLVGIGALRQLDGGGEDIDGVIALGGGHRRWIAGFAVGLVVAVDEALDLGCDRVLDEGLRHQGAIAVLARVVDVVGHRQGPAADQGLLHPQLCHAVGHGRQFRPDAPDQDALGAAVLGFQQLGGHVLVAVVVFLGGHHLQLVALLLDLVEQVVASGYPVVGRVMEDRHLGELAVVGFLHLHGGLDAVIGGEAEDGQVFFFGFVFLGFGGGVCCWCVVLGVVFFLVFF